MTGVIDIIDMGYAFTALVVVIGILLIVGTYVNYTRNNIPLALLCGGTLLMLVSPPLPAVIIMVAVAVVLAIGGDTRTALTALVLAVVSYVLSLVIVNGTMLVATAVGAV